MFTILALRALSDVFVLGLNTACFFLFEENNLGPFPRFDELTIPCFYEKFAPYLKYLLN